MTSTSIRNLVRHVSAAVALAWVPGAASVGCAGVAPAVPGHGISAPPSSTAPAPIAVPGEIACTLRSTEWAPRAGTLRLRQGGPSFVSVAGGRMIELRIAVDAGRDGAWVRVDVGDNVTGHVTIDGLLAPGDVDLFAARPFAIGGTVVPFPWTRLAVAGARPGMLEIAAPLGHVKVPAVMARAERPCGDLSPTMTQYDPLVALPGATVIGTATLASGPGAKVALAPEPGRARAIEITTGARGVETVDVLATAGAERRIAYYGDESLVVGWAPSASLAPAGSVARDWTPAAPSEGVGKRSFGSTVTCGRDLDLVAEMAGDRRRVGVVHAGALVDVGTSRDGYAEVELPRTLMTTAPQAVLLVSSSALATCVPAGTSRHH